MSTFWKKATGVLLASAVIGSLGVANPAEAATAKKGSKRTVTATIRGGKDLTVILVSGTGRTLASKKITRTTQKVTLRTAAVSTTAGMNLQLVNSGGTSSGEYFGPVVLNWKGTSAKKAKRVYTRLKTTKSSKISLGTITVTKVGTAKKQGYATATKKVTLANTSTAVAVIASKGRPSGVGTYGKKAKIGAQSVTGSSVSVSAANLPAVVNPPPPNPPQPNQPQPEGAVAADEDTLGGDKDKDGIPNAFDVDDDGDAIVDAADSNSPTPKVSADDGLKDCGSIDWNIFTNFKATGENFVGTLNAYGTGNFQSTGASTSTAVENTMTMVFAPITQVCGSAVTKTEIKGNGVSYAPATYEDGEVSRTCSTNDYQWLIGKGRMCGTDAQGYAFHTENKFTPATLPSGQDTFSMRVTTANGGVYEFTSSPGFVFVSHPMLASYSIDGGAETAINYGASIPRIGITSTSTLTLKLYRPQRFAIDGEGGQVYDLGGFRYSADIPNGTVQGSPGPGKCDASTVPDTAMASDTVFNPSSKPTITLTWDIGKCFTSRNTAWQTGNLNVDIMVEPAGRGGNSAQKLFLTLS